MAFLNGKYSVSYKKFIAEHLCAEVKIQYSNKKGGYISWIGAPYEKVYDFSVITGANYYPFQEKAGGFAAVLVETGYASVTLDKERTPTPDSIKASGFFLGPTVDFGYKFVIRNRVFISPSLSLIYNFNFIDYSKIGKWENTAYWSIKEDFPFLLTWNQLHSIKKGFEYQLSLNVGITF